MKHHIASLSASILAVAISCSLSTTAFAHGYQHGRTSAYRYSQPYAYPSTIQNNAYLSVYPQPRDGSYVWPYWQPYYSQPPVVSSYQPSATVFISYSQFQPQVLRVARGTMVTWFNDDDRPHTVKGNKNDMQSKMLNPGDRYSYTFRTSGSFLYRCQLHPEMWGIVEVVD